MHQEVHAAPGPAVLECCSAVTCHHAAGYEIIKTVEITIIIPLLPCPRMIQTVTLTRQCHLLLQFGKNILLQKISQLCVSHQAGGAEIILWSGVVWCGLVWCGVVFERNISIISVLSLVCRGQV